MHRIQEKMSYSSIHSRDAQKFFKDGKLKYPDVDTTKQSKKYVRALKLLKVSQPVDGTIDDETTKHTHTLSL